MRPRSVARSCRRCPARDRMLTSDALFGALGTTPAGAPDQAWADTVCVAVNDYVSRLPHVVPMGSTWDGPTETGAVMLGMRLYSARSAPLGAAGYDVTGALVRATSDPEVGRMLRVGRYAMPRVG